MPISLVQNKVSSEYDYYGGIGVANTKSRSNGTATLDAPATAGNLLIAVCTTDKNATSYSVPAGWTQLWAVTSTNVSTQAVYKTAVGGETSVTFAWGGTQFGSVLYMVEINGGELGDFAAKAVTTTTSSVFGPVTSVSSDALAMVYFCMDSADGSNPGTDMVLSWSNGFSTIAQRNANVSATATQGEPGISVATKTLPTVETVSTTAVTRLSDETTGFLLVIEPTNTEADVTPPTVTSIVVPTDGNTAVVTLDENVLPSTGVTGFTATVGGASRSVTASRTSSNVITLTFSTPVYSGESVSITYAPGNVTDNSTNALASFTTSATNNSSAVEGDITAPTVSSIVVPSTGLTVVVTLSEDVLPSTGITGFSATVAGASRTISSVSRTSSNVITLTFATAVLPGETVTVTYAPGNVTDTSSNALASFTTTATNNSTVAGTVVSRWAGGVTATSAVVNTKVSIDHNVRVNAYLTSDTATVVTSSTVVAAVSATNNRMTRHELSGLSPDTSYTCYVEINGTEDRTKPQVFQTFPVEGTATSFDFGFASCAYTGSASTVFNRIRTRNLRFFCHTGDLHYQNIGVNDVALYRSAYDSVLASSTQSAMYASLPIDYVWDDHDFGMDNSSGSSASRPAACSTYREYFPHYPLPSSNGAIHHSFVYGRVRFVVTDTRSERSGSSITDDVSKVVMSSEQKAWFFNELGLARDAGQVVIWVNTYPWVGATPSGEDWSRYQVARAEVANWIKDNNMSGRIAMINGDMHGLAADDGTNSDYATGGGAAIPVCQAAALDQGGSVKGGPYSQGILAGGGQYGVMSVIDTGGSTIDFQFRGKNSSDADAITMDFSLGIYEADTTAPTVSSIVVPSNGLTAVVTFNEDVEPSTGITGFLATVGGASRSVTAARTSANVITLTFGSVVYTGEAVSITYAPGNVTDTSSNALAGFTTSATNNSTVPVPDVAAPTVSSIVVPSNGLTAVVTFDEGVLPSTGVTGFLATVAGASRSVTAARTSSTTITLTFGSVVYTGEAVSITYAPGNVTDSSSNALASFTSAATNNSTVPVPDTTAPAVSTIVLPSNGLTAVVTFDEGVLPSTGVTGFTATVGGASRSVTASRTSSNVITLTFSSVVYSGEAVSIAYAPGNVTDASSNALASFSTTATNNSTVPVPPVAGTISLVAKTTTTISLSATAATGGVEPYSYQWTRDGSPVSGATGLTLEQSGLTPSTMYSYGLTATDTASQSVNYAALGVTTDAVVPDPDPDPPGVRYRHLNSAVAKVATVRAPGSSSLQVDDASRFSGAAFPLRLSVVRFTGGGSPFGDPVSIFRATGLAGTTFTLDGTIEGESDAQCEVGDYCFVGPTAGDFSDLWARLEALEAVVANLV